VGLEIWQKLEVRFAEVGAHNPEAPRSRSPFDRYFVCIGTLLGAMSESGPERHLARCKDMSELEVKADSKANVEFGRD
jgi:hypothetical protein